MLIAYHGDPKIKAKYMRRIRAHYKADLAFYNHDIQQWRKPDGEKT